MTARRKVSQGSINRPGAIPAFLRTPTVMQPHLDMKPFLQFPLDTPHSAGIFPNFTAMDPVQKAVINHTFGVPLIKTKRPVISCNVCQIRFNSESQAEAHYKGNRHARRVKGIETSKCRPKDGEKSKSTTSSSTSNPVTSHPSSKMDPVRPDDQQPLQRQNGPSLAPPPLAMATGPQDSSSIAPLPLIPASRVSGTITVPTHPLVKAPHSDFNVGITNGTLGPTSSSSPATSPESEEDKAKKLLYCSLCKVAVNSLSQLEAHNKGTKHKTILEARSGLGPIKAYPRLGPKLTSEQGGGTSDPNAQERTFHCEICNVRVNSEVQLKQHISSRRHRDGVAGKPNPLLSRHKKQRTGDVTDLPKALGAGLLPSPLAVAAAMAAAASSSPLALRAPHPPTTHLLQGPPLTHTLLRPAPGPIRTSHGPILFSPY
ncbi:Z385A protein, partial [Polypterus senegalus]|nr:Z385A protein [Polypterus senegalus]